MKFAGGPRSWK